MFFETTKTQVKNTRVLSNTFIHTAFILSKVMFFYYSNQDDLILLILTHVQLVISDNNLTEMHREGSTYSNNKK